MKIKTPTEFKQFNDGLCAVYTVDGNKLDKRVLSIRYGDKVIGVKRYYAARTETSRIDRLIQVPQCRMITARHNVTISGVRYLIEQVQHLDDTNPPTTVLTLRRLGVMPIARND